MKTFRKILAFPAKVLMWAFLAPGYLFMILSVKIEGDNEDLC